MKLFQTKFRFVGHDIFNGTIKPIQRSIEFADKFSDEIKDKSQLQRFLGCLNYVVNFFPNLGKFANHYFKDSRKILLHGLMSILK